MRGVQKSLWSYACRCFRAFSKCDLGGWRVEGGELLRGRRGSKGRPRPSQDAPKRSPGPPPGRPKTFSEASGPITFFGKIAKVEIVENMSKKKRSTAVIHGGHPHPSSQKPRALSKRSEPRGWRRWSREALFNKNKSMMTSNPLSRFKNIRLKNCVFHVETWISDSRPLEPVLGRKFHVESEFAPQNTQI